MMKIKMSTILLNAQFDNNWQPQPARFSNTRAILLLTTVCSDRTGHCVLCQLAKQQRLHTFDRWYVTEWFISLMQTTWNKFLNCCQKSISHLQLFVASVVKSFGYFHCLGFFRITSYILYTFFTKTLSVYCM